MMRFPHSTFGFLPPLSDQQIAKQIVYCLRNGWAIHIEHTADPDPRNYFWERWGIPLFDVDDPELVIHEIDACCQRFPDHYVRVTAHEASPGVKTPRLSFIVSDPQGRASQP